MAVFTAYEPPEPPSDRYERAERVELVREGFNLLALAAAPLWLLANRLWLALAGYAGIAMLLLLAYQHLAAPLWLIRVALLALHLLVALEGDTLRRWSLEWRGWRMLGSVIADNVEEAERRFLDAWMPTLDLERGPPVQAAISAGAGWSGLSRLLRRGI